jgi:hypothetical protein
MADFRKLCKRSQAAKTASHPRPRIVRSMFHCRDCPALLRLGLLVAAMQRSDIFFALRHSRHLGLHGGNKAPREKGPVGCCFGKVRIQRLGVRAARQLLPPQALGHLRDELGDLLLVRTLRTVFEARLLRSQSAREPAASSPGSQSAARAMFVSASAAHSAMPGHGQAISRTSRPCPSGAPILLPRKGKQ